LQTLIILFIPQAGHLIYIFSAFIVENYVESVYYFFLFK